MLHYIILDDIKLYYIMIYYISYCSVLCYIYIYVCIYIYIYTYVSVNGVDYTAEGVRRSGSDARKVHRGVKGVQGCAGARRDK